MTDEQARDFFEQFFERVHTISNSKTLSNDEFVTELREVLRLFNPPEPTRSS